MEKQELRDAISYFLFKCDKKHETHIIDVKIPLNQDNLTVDKVIQGPDGIIFLTIDNKESDIDIVEEIIPDVYQQVYEGILKKFAEQLYSSH